MSQTMSRPRLSSLTRPTPSSDHNQPIGLLISEPEIPKSVCPSSTLVLSQIMLTCDTSLYRCFNFHLITYSSSSSRSSKSTNKPSSGSSTDEFVGYSIPDKLVIFDRVRGTSNSSLLLSTIKRQLAYPSLSPTLHWLVVHRLP